MRSLERNIHEELRSWHRGTLRFAVSVGWQRRSDAGVCIMYSIEARMGDALK